MESFKEFFLGYVCKNIRQAFGEVDNDIFSFAEEIRIRLNKPMYLKAGEKEWFVNEKGVCGQALAYIPKREDMRETMELISRHSTYAFEEEIKQGFIPLPKGVRVGICGKAVLERGEIKTIKNISGFNFRIPREVIGCCKKVIDFIVYPKIMHTLIVSPPCCGKTTMLRDIIRTLSFGIDGKFKGVTVGVADERSEIGGSFFGEEQNNLGPRTDIIDGGKKGQAVYMLLRAMSPNVIAFDELGNEEEVCAVCDAVNSGVKIICTIHSDNIEDLKTRYIFQKIFQKNIFERYIVLSDKFGSGTLEGVYDKDFVKIND